MRLSMCVIISSVLLFGAAQADAQGGAYTLPQDTPANIRRAVQSSDRPAEQRERDFFRRPAEVLTLLGIAEGDSVIELGSFGNYYTALLAEAVGPEGFVHMIDMPWTEPFGGAGSRAFENSHDNSSYTLAHFNRAEFPRDVDAVMIVLFYHDLKVQTGSQSVDTIDMNARIFAALRPGGRYLVIDHKAEDFSGWDGAAGLHRIDEVTIINEAMAAGFELVATSNILANPDDDHRISMRDPSIRGRTDRAVLVFQKPED